MAAKNDYNWLDDPFNDKKAPAASERMGSGTKIMIGCGLLIAIVAVIVAAVIFMMAMMSAGS